MQIFKRNWIHFKWRKALKTRRKDSLKEKKNSKLDKQQRGAKVVCEEKKNIIYKLVSFIIHAYI